MINFLKKTYKWFIGLFLIAGASAAVIGVLPTTPTLTEVPIIKTQIGEKYIHKFQDKTTGAIFEVETTKLEYDALAKKGANQPTYSNAKWLSSSGGVPIYATSTPTLLDNQYVVISGTATGTGQALIKMPNEAEKIIDTSLIPK